MNKKFIFLIVALHVLTWLALKPVWPFSDDYCYAYHAHNLLEGHLNLTYNQFQNRFGVYVPVSFFFYLFGTNPYSISFWPLIISCFTITIVFLFVSKIADTTIALISAFLISINTIQINYSTALFPDLIVSFYCIGAILLLYYGRQTKNQKIIYPLLLNLFLLIGFISKETIVLIFPFLLIVLIYDLFKKENVLFWKRTFAYGFCSIALLLLMYYCISGDAFFRIKSLFQFNNEFLNVEAETFIRSNFSSNIFKWLNSEVGLIFLLLFAISTLLTIRKYDLSKFMIFITVYSFSTLLVFVCFFYSDKYAPLFMLSRMWMLLIPSLCILTAYFIINMHQHFCVVLIVLFITLTLYNFNTFEYKRGLLFALFLSTTLVTYYLSRKNKNWSYLLLLPFTILAIRFVWGNSNYRVSSIQSGELLKNEIEHLNASGKKTILCAGDFVENHIIYNQFKEYSNLKFYPFNKYDSLNQAPNLFVLVNTEEVEIPNYVLNNSSEWKKEYDSGKLLIYRKVE